ncbi:hypothetical protein Pelo_5240 [Pelomyxa schiedti]|nr:hypothetical protein Pelo_5240 [Pelomyxa schiedti]
MHCDEVLFGRVQPCGAYLATASRDRMLFLFRTESIVSACNSSGVSQVPPWGELPLANPCSVWRAAFDNAKVSWSSDSKFLVVDEAVTHGTQPLFLAFYSYAWWIDAGVVVYRTPPSQVVINDLIHNTSHIAAYKLPLPVPQNQGTYRSMIATLTGHSRFSDVWFYKLNKDRGRSMRFVGKQVTTPV